MAPVRKLQSTAPPVQAPQGERARRELHRVRGADLAVFRLAGDSAPEGRLLVWAHGWGQAHEALLPLAQAMRQAGESVLLDLPGFGISPVPPAAWSTADYADAAAEWLAGVPATQRIWVAHSFGCRVGLQLAARHPGLVDGLFLVAAPGLPPRRSLPEQMRFAARRWSFRLARLLLPEGPALERLRRQYGSEDYRKAGPMRPVLVKAVNENLAAAARAVRCPAVLVYGERDRDAPADIGERYAAMLPQARLVVLRGFGHLDIVGEGRHQIAQLLGDFLERLE